MGVLAVVLIGLAVLAVYWFDVWRHPWHPCPRCSGSKSHKSSIRHGAYGRCRKCKGTGNTIRWATRVLTPGAYREMKAGHSGRNY